VWCWSRISRMHSSVRPHHNPHDPQFTNCTISRQVVHSVLLPNPSLSKPHFLP
jgi:hypothetical protein